MLDVIASLSVAGAAAFIGAAARDGWDVLKSALLKWFGDEPERTEEFIASLDDRVQEDPVEGDIADLIQSWLQEDDSRVARFRSFMESPAAQASGNQQIVIQGNAKAAIQQSGTQHNSF